MKRKIIGFVLIFSYILTLTVFARDSTAVYSKEIEYLSAYGIMSALSDEAMNEKITQSEFRNAISVIVDSDEQTMKKIDSFGEVYDAEGEVTLLKAVMTLVKLIGYDNLAIQNGGTNNGYMNVAMQNGITDGIKSTGQDDTITYAQAAKLIYNTLQAPLVTMTFEGGKAVYKVDKEKTLLTEEMSVYNVKGIVTATADYALPGYSKTRQGVILIGDSEYEISQVSMKNYFGCYVDAEYQYNEDDDISKIIKMKSKYNNDVLNIVPNDVESFDVSGEYIYIDTETDREKRAVIESDATYYYNYEAVNSQTDMSGISFIPQTGSIKLIDNNQNGKYDIVIILDYEVRVVETAESENIYTKYGESAVEITYDTIITDSSGAIFNDASVLSENDIVHVIFENGTDKAKYVYIQTQSVTGTITYIDRDVQKIIILDGDKEYDIPDSKYDLSAILKARMNVTLYLDMNSNFAGYDITASTDWVYGYMVDIKTYLSEDTGEDVLSVKLYDVNERKLKTLFCREKVKAEGITYKKAAYQTLIDNLGLYEYMEDGTKRVWDQLIRYKVNSDGLITEMDFAPNAADYSAIINMIPPSTATGLYKLTGSMSYLASNDASTIASAMDRTRSRLPYWANSHPIYHKRIILSENGQAKYNTWHPEITVSNDTVALFVPQDRNNEEGYRVSTAGVSRSEPQLVIDFFTVAEESESTTIMVIYDGDGAPTSDSAGGVNNDVNIIDPLSTAYIITDINEVYLEDSELVTHQIDLCGVNGEITLYTKNDQWVDTVGMEKGDFVAMSYSGQFINAIDILTSVDEFKDYQSPDFKNLTAEVFGDRGQIVGYAYENRDGIGLVTSDPANINNLTWGELTVMPIQTAAPMYEYDAKTGEVTASDLSCIKWYQNTHDLEKTSIVYTGYQNADAKYTFIINNLFE